MSKCKDKNIVHFINSHGWIIEEDHLIVIPFIEEVLYVTQFYRVLKVKFLQYNAIVIE